MSEIAGVPFAHVVYATNITEARDFYSGDLTRIEGQSFVFERMEAYAVVYHEVGGQLLNVLVSD